MFEAVKLTKNADLDKYRFRGYGFGFDSCFQFSLSDGSWGKNVIIFGADMNSAAHVDNKKKDNFVLVGGATQSLDITTITTEAIYSTDFTESGQRFVLSLLYNRSNSFLFLSAVKM